MSDDPIPAGLVELSERLIRMEGKIDAYSAGQTATLAEHGRRLDGHDRAIEDLRQAPPEPAPKSSSTAQWVGIGVSLLVALIGILGLIVTLIRVIPDVAI